MKPEGAREGEWTLPRLRVDVNGDWFDGELPITHEGIVASLRANLRRGAEGYFIQTRVRIPVDVEDVPWIVVRVEPEGDRLRAILNDESEERLEPASIRLGRGDVPYCPVKGGLFEARLSRAATFQLLALADYDERTGRGTLEIGGQRFPLRRAE